MNSAGILEQVLGLAGTFDPKLFIILFLVCSVGELAIPVPYLLEMVWLLSGYNLSTGAFSPLHLVLLWLVAQAGRQTGATTLYHLGRFGGTPVVKLYREYLGRGLPEKLSGNSIVPFKLFHKVDSLSPFSVALGRLLGLRVPLTVTLALKRRWRLLSLGVLLSSLVWDSLYLSLGIAGASLALRPTRVILYSLIGLTLLYALIFALRRLLRLRPSISA